MVKGIFAFDVALDFRYNNPRYVVYGLGQEDNHVMDWAGCNFHRARVPDGGPFKTFAEAKKFIRNECEGKITHLYSGGTHAAEIDDLWELRKVEDEVDQEFYEQLQQEYRRLKKSGKARRLTY